MPRVSLRDLCTLAYANGLTHWSYKAGDHSAADVLRSTYWEDARGKPDAMRFQRVLAPGDFIFVSGQGWGMQLYVYKTEPLVTVGMMMCCGAIGSLSQPEDFDEPTVCLRCEAPSRDGFDGCRDPACPAGERVA